MRLLFATGRSLFPFFRGGDGTTAAQMLAGLSNYGVTCLAIGKLDPVVAPWPLQTMIKTLEQKSLRHTVDSNELRFWTEVENRLVISTNFSDTLQQAISDFQPDVVLTQLEDSALVIQIAQANRIPAILYVHDATQPNHTSLSQPGLTLVFYNSQFIAGQFTQYSAIPSAVVYPIVDPELYRLDRHIPKFVTMVNPTSHKGARILEQCCQALPEIPFQVILGWSGSNIDFSRYPNVTVIPFSDDIRPAYTSSRFMLVPSQWAEPFCRIPVEAGLNHIPVIASNIGGLPESVGNGGILLNRYNETPLWIKAIQNLYDNPTEVIRLGRRANLHAQRFTLANTISDLTERIKTISR